MFIAFLFFFKLTINALINIFFSWTLIIFLSNFNPSNCWWQTFLLHLLLYMFFNVSTNAVPFLSTLTNVVKKISQKNVSTNVFTSIWTITATIIQTATHITEVNTKQTLLATNVLVALFFKYHLDLNAWETNNKHLKQVCLTASCVHRVNATRWDH